MLSFEDQPFGEIRYRVSASTEVLEIAADCNFKCSVSGQVREWSGESTTRWSLDGFYLRDSRSTYSDGMGLVTTTEGERQTVTVLWERGGLHGEAATICQRMPALLLEPNIFGGAGLELLPQHISWTGDVTQLVCVVDPAMACSQLTSAALVFPARVVVAGQAQIRTTGRAVETAVVEVVLPMVRYRAYYSMETGQLVRYELPDCGVVAQLIAGEPPRIGAVDMSKLTEQTVDAAMWSIAGQSVRDPYSLERVECEIDVAFCAPPASDQLASLNAGTQSFVGQVQCEDGIWRATGRLTNQSAANGNWIGSTRDGTPELGSGIGRELALTQPEARIESDHPAIAAKAREIAGDSETYWEATRRVIAWVSSNIKYQVTYGTALSALETRTGDCAPRAYLSVAMLRALGVPSRAVSGVMLVKDQVGSHVWVEVYLGEKPGWVSVDPIEPAQIEFFSAAHLRLWSGDGIVAAAVSRPSITVTAVGY